MSINRLDDLNTVRQAAKETTLLVVDKPLPGNNKLLLKLESEQEIGSFKIRGATLAMASDLESLRKRGVVADSGGNHAQAIALASNRLGVPAKVVMASVVPEGKKQATLNFGAKDGSFELDTSPPSFVEAKANTKALAGWSPDGELPEDESKYPKYLSPYDDPDIVRGTATIVPELEKQLKAQGREWPDTVHIPIGGGGLISGIADVNAEQGGLFELYGHGMVGADSAARSLRAIREEGAEEPASVEGDPDTIVEGLSVKVMGQQGFQRLKDDKIKDIYTSELADVGRAYDWYKQNVLPQLGVDLDDEEQVWANLPEVSSMVTMAGLFNFLEQTGVEDQTHLVLISGGNIDRAKAEKAFQAAD